MNRSVDVIIPTYNGLPYLKQTVDSILAQTHKDLVLYIIDDGSTDQGATEKYAKSLKDKRVRYHKKSNGGQATARNFGISISDSPYITFLDSDDLWHPDKLKLQLELMDKNQDIGMVYGLCKLIDAANNTFSEVVWQKRGDLFDYLLNGNKISGSASMVMVRRSVFEKVGTFHEDFLIGEDWEMWLRIAKYYQIDYVPDYIASLRVLDSGMQQNYAKMAKGLEYMLPIMVKELRLGVIERAKLAKTCLKDACLQYYNSGNKAEARRVFFTSFAYNPFTFFTLNHHVLFLYLRIILGTEWLRQLRRKTSASYRQREAHTIAEKTAVTKNPLVSVLLPVYNGGEYLKPAIQSILDQTFKDFEFIIINDGSTDDSKKIINSFKDSRIVCVDQENQGIVASLNTALKLAKGTFIARQDADDLSAPLRLEKQLEAMHRDHELVLVGTNAARINSAGKKTGEIKLPQDDASLRVAMLSYNPFVHGSVLMKASVLKKVGGYESEFWPAEDYRLWAKLLMFGKASNIPQDLYRHRSVETSITSLNSKEQTAAVIATRRKIVARSARILGSPLVLKKALDHNPTDPHIKKGAHAAWQSSWLHLHILNGLFLTLSLLLALPVSIKNKRMVRRG